MWRFLHCLQLGPGWINSKIAILSKIVISMVQFGHIGQIWGFNQQKERYIYIYLDNIWVIFVDFEMITLLEGGRFYIHGHLKRYFLLWHHHWFSNTEFVENEEFFSTNSVFENLVLDKFGFQKFGLFFNQRPDRFYT